MIFSSEVFLFVFLPITICLYFLSGRFKNILSPCCVATLLRLGRTSIYLLMLISIASNYLFGLIVERLHMPHIRKIVLAVSCIFNLALLAVYKYTGFVVSTLNSLRFAIADPGIALPIGIQQNA